MDIPIEKKRFTKSKIAIAIGSLLLITFIIFVIVSTGGRSKLNVDSERISISEVKEGVFQEGENYNIIKPDENLRNAFKNPSEN